MDYPPHLSFLTRAIHMAAREEAGQPSPRGEVLEQKYPPTHPRTPCVRSTPWRRRRLAEHRGGASTRRRRMGAARPARCIDAGRRPTAAMRAFRHFGSRRLRKASTSAT